jgi:hypothetical protein
MANERVVRTNNCLGVLGAAMGSGDTTVTFASAPPWPTIGTNNFAKLILEPNSASEEICYVTAYTAAALTATIVRAQEGTSAVAHPPNAFWQSGPTANDFPLNVDTPWGGNLGYDYEFDNPYTTSIPSGWVWDNQGTATYLEHFGAGVFSVPASASENVVSLQQPISAAASFTATAKMSGAGLAAAYFSCGVILKDKTTTNKFVTHGFVWSYNQVGTYLWSSLSANSTIAATSVSMASLQVVYFRIVKNSSTSWNFGFSPDGRAWYDTVAAYNVPTTGGFTPTHFGIYVNARNSAVAQASCEWFRVR